MEFAIKVGIDGFQFNVCLGFDEGQFININQVQQLQESIYQVSKVELKNQLILSKKGVKIDDLQMFNNDSFLKQTNAINDAKTFVINYYLEQSIYLFDLSENPEIQPYLLPKFEVKMEIKQLQLTESARETIMNLNGGLLNMEKQYFQHLSNIKNKYVPYQQKIKAFEKLGLELENQVQSFEVLLKMISLNYSQTKQKKNEVFKKCKDSIDRNSVTVKKFDESLDNLKSIELHPSLQTESQKFLSDIYYKPESMHKWKNSCLNTSQSVKSKLEKTTSYLKKLKIKIKEERNTTITNCINSYKSHQNQFQSFISDSKQLIQSVVQSSLDEYNTLKQHLITFSENVNDEPSLHFLLQFEIGPQQVQQFEDSVLQLSEHLEKVNKSIEVFNRLRLTNQTSIQSIFKIMRNFNKEFDQLNDKIKSIDDEVDKMEKDFSYLLNPVQLPSAYQQALQETSRRREFRDLFNKKMKTLTQIIETEKEKRKKFLQTYGRILPQDFFGQLKNLTPSIQVLNAFADAELPNITGMHTDFYRKEKYDPQSLVQQIEDLHQQLKQTHLYYQQENTAKKQSSIYNDLLQMTAKNSMKLFIQRAEAKPLASIDMNQDSKILKDHSEQLRLLKLEYEESQNKLFIAEKQSQQYQTDIVKLTNELLQEKAKLEQSKILSQDHQDLTIQLHKLQELYKDEEQKVQQLNQDKAKNELIIQQLQSQSNDLVQQLVQIQNRDNEKQNDHARDELQETQEFFEPNMETELDEMSTQIQTLLADKDKYQQEIEQLKLIITQLENQMNQSSNAYEEGIRLAQSELQDSVEKINNLNSQLLQMEQKCNDQDIQLKNLKERIISDAQQIQVYLNKISFKSSQQFQIQGEYYESKVTLNSQLSDQNFKQSAQLSNSVIEQETQTMKDLIEQQESQIRQQSQNISNLENKIQTLQSQNSSQSNIIEELAYEIEQLNTQLQEQSTELQSLQSTRELEQQKIDTQQQQIQKLNQELFTKELGMDRLKNLVAQDTQRIQSLLFNIQDFSTKYGSIHYPREQQLVNTQ